MGKLLNFFDQWPFKFLLPSLLTVILFSAVIFFYLIPNHEKSIIEHKRESIKMMVDIIWTDMAQYEEMVRNNEIGEEEAKRTIIRTVRQLRYGEEMKDYFWINDLHPRMVMHPYRADLEGKDLSDHKDPNGKHLFQEFAKVAKESGNGYVEYMWQWKDESKRIVPKLS